jgi:hypothetical protein
MSLRSTVRSVRRPALVGAAALTAFALGAAPAMAHHCYVPMYSLNGPTSPNWFVLDAETAARFVVGYEAPCQAAVDAGYAALREQGLPVGIKIFEKMTIGDPKETGRTNPNGANSKGLEYFGEGSPLADQMVAEWMEAASGVACDA